MNCDYFDHFLFAVCVLLAKVLSWAWFSDITATPLQQKSNVPHLTYIHSRRRSSGMLSLLHKGGRGGGECSTFCGKPFAAGGFFTFERGTVAMKGNFVIVALLLCCLFGNCDN